ncbi:hypothetical protein Q7P37_001392 [Cladosporium fusiforme]
MSAPPDGTAAYDVANHNQRRFEVYGISENPRIPNDRADSDQAQSCKNNSDATPDFPHCCLHKSPQFSGVSTWTREAKLGTDFRARLYYTKYRISRGNTPLWEYTDLAPCPLTFSIPCSTLRGLTNSGRILSEINAEDTTADDSYGLVEMYIMPALVRDQVEFAIFDS